MYGSASIRTSAFCGGEGFGGIEGGGRVEEAAIVGASLQNKKGLSQSGPSFPHPGGRYWIAILRPVTACFFGSVSSSTPWANFAFAFASSISCGSAKRRSVLP